MNKFLVFDTETNGLPKNWKRPMSDLDNWPRVIQLAWIITDKHGIELKKEKHLILPDGWTIPEEKFWIDNGYSQWNSEMNGVPLPGVIDIFISDLNDADALISHNMSFDYNVLGAEFMQYGKKSGKQLHRFCTKELSTAYCKLPGNYGFKWPQLIELHQILFNEGFQGAHDALVDVYACARCFHELVKRNVIKIPATV